MAITPGSLYRDTMNFCSHQFFNIIVMAFLASFITLLIGKALSPGVDEMQVLGKGAVGSARSLVEMIQNLSPEQQRVLLRASATGTLSSLVGNVLLLGGMLCLIPMASAGQKISALRAIGTSAPYLPSLLLLTILMTIVIQLGFGLMVLPGVILAVLLALAPVILFTEKVGIITAVRASLSLGWSQIKLVAPAVMFWIVAKLCIVLLTTKLLALLPQDIAVVLLNALSNLISALLTIYLSRLYMLLR